MINAAPPTLAEFWSNPAINSTTVVFGSNHPGAVETPFIERHNDNAVFLDQRDGVWRGVSSRTIDGMGRQVGQKNWTAPTDYTPYLIIP